MDGRCQATVAVIALEANVSFTQPLTEVSAPVLSEDRNPSSPRLSSDHTSSSMRRYRAPCGTETHVQLSEPSELQLKRDLRLV